MENSKLTVLVVDDNPVQLKLLLSMLQETGYNVRVAENGTAALDILQTIPINLILLDILMPGIDGLGTCRQIKANKETADIPIIFMTALDQLEDKITGFKAGCVDYITKPFHHDEVLVRVQTHLKLRQQQQSLEESLAEIKKMSGILPICCKCKKIRDDKGYWQQVDHYITNHADIQFSHGYCEDCYAEEMETITESQNILPSSKN